jgi:D-alanyl-D-alanine dipeptidase
MAPDWTSSEVMLRPDSLYKYGVIVGHNTASPLPGGGSCIFLHLWRGLGSTTIGCTAGDEADMQKLFGWIDPAQTPLFVQLPQPVYDAVKGTWGLP